MSGRLESVIRRPRGKMGIERSNLTAIYIIEIGPAPRDDIERWNICFWTGWNWTLSNLDKIHWRNVPRSGNSTRNRSCLSFYPFQIWEMCKRTWRRISSDPRVLWFKMWLTILFGDAFWRSRLRRWQKIVASFGTGQFPELQYVVLDAEHDPLEQPSRLCYVEEIGQLVVCSHECIQVFALTGVVEDAESVADEDLCSRL